MVHANLVFKTLSFIHHLTLLLYIHVSSLYSGSSKSNPGWILLSSTSFLYTFHCKEIRLSNNSFCSSERSSSSNSSSSFSISSKHFQTFQKRISLSKPHSRGNIVVCFAKNCKPPLRVIRASVHLPCIFEVVVGPGRIMAIRLGFCRITVARLGRLRYSGYLYDLDVCM